jgi:hypothetical protein
MALRNVLLIAVLCAAACKRSANDRIEEITVGGHVCARYASGDVECWGYGNDYGQLGRGGDDERGPVTVRGVSGATAIAAASERTTCAILAGGEVECWGIVWGPEGKRRQRIPGVRGAVRLIMGAFRGCAIAADGEATCWGPGSEGNLIGGWPPAKDERFRGAIAGVGVDDILCATLPDRIHCSMRDYLQFDLPPAEAVAVTSPTTRVCALRKGAVKCGDVDAKGILTDVVTRQLGFIALSGAGGELCGVLPGGEVRCTDVGILQRDEHYEPLSGLSAPLQLAAGWETCALTRERKVVCWELPRLSQPMRVVLPSPPYPN